MKEASFQIDEIDAKLAQAVVLLNRQFLLIDHLIETNRSTLVEFEQSIAEECQSLDHVLNVYNYVFALVDHLVRYQKIAFVLPRLSQKKAEFRAFGDAMGDLKEIRNQLQHINNDLENEYSGPLLGAVFWISQRQQYCALFHDIGRERSSPGISSDTLTGQYTQEFCYVYNDVHHDLSKAIQGVRDFNRFISSQVDVKLDGKPYDPKEHFSALCFKFQ